ncbi:hypothetical protein AAKU55_005895 [Oxalobacteraceae bacterium GrIS 1.11]
MDFCNDDEIYLYGIWGDLVADLCQLKDYFGESSVIKDELTYYGDAGIINNDLKQMDGSDFVRLVAAQFLRLLDEDLPERFPFVAFCNTCDFVPIAIRASADNVSCQKCESHYPTGYFNMRLFQNRELFLQKKLGTHSNSILRG